MGTRGYPRAIEVSHRNLKQLLRNRLGVMLQITDNKRSTAKFCHLVENAVSFVNKGKQQSKLLPPSGARCFYFVLNFRVRHIVVGGGDGFLPLKAIMALACLIARTISSKLLSEISSMRTEGFPLLAMTTSPFWRTFSQMFQLSNTHIAWKLFVGRLVCLGTMIDKFKGDRLKV